MWRQSDIGPGAGPGGARLGLSALALAVILGACGGGGPAAGPAAEDHTTDASVSTYRVEGEVRRLPREGASRREVLIAHAEVPDFVDQDGEVVGMEAMTMSFPLAEPEMLEDLVVGDRVDVDFRVDWQGTPPLVITRLEKLPPTEPSEEEPEAEAGTEPASTEPADQAHAGHGG